MVGEFKTNKPKLSTITLKTEKMVEVLTNVNAPTDKNIEWEKELFYRILKDIFDSIKRNIILVMRDFNVKIKRERYY